jgi:hypothetical protein
MFELAKAGIGGRRIMLAAVGLALGLGVLTSSPASAYWDRWHHWRGPCCAPGFGVVIGAPPPVYVAPPPVYYAPPPVVYAPPPGISLNIR